MLKGGRNGLADGCSRGSGSLESMQGIAPTERTG